MNIYVVTEGKAERKVYKHWIPLVNPSLSCVDRIEEVDTNSFYLVSGGGYPAYFHVIERAIEDVNVHTIFNRLVISVDSEEMTKEDKYQEIEEFLSEKRCRVEIRVVIQHFCFETWGLGNRLIIRRNTQSTKLSSYRNIFDVRISDPELLPANTDEELNRSQFAERYLKAALNDRFRTLTYTKSNPTPLLHNGYFGQLKNRFVQTGDIGSFEDFLNAFV